MRKILFFLILILVIGFSYGIGGEERGLVRVGDRTFTSISEALEYAEPGSTIYVESGVFHEHLTIEKSVSIIGIGYPVVDGGGHGSVIVINNTEGVKIEGLKIVNSGTSYSAEDSGIKIIDSRHVVISKNVFENVFFGILVKDSDDVLIIGNSITSIPEFSITEREHAVYAWYSRRVRVINNTFTQVKDGVYYDHVYDSTVEGNYAEDARYGVHLMYCENITITRNYISSSIAGMAPMYSINLEISYNTIYLNRVGGIGEGAFIVENDNVTVEYNSFVGNIVGIHIRKTPYKPGAKAVVRNNLIAFNYVGISIDTESEVLLYANSIIENIRDISLIGFGSGGNKWFDEESKTGNFWSSYRGQDLNGDGRGDEPFVSQNLLEDLLDGYSQLKLFTYSPSYLILEVMKKSFPVNPRIKAVDQYPLIKPLHRIEAKTVVSFEKLIIPLFLTITPLASIYYLRKVIGS